MKPFLTRLSVIALTALVGFAAHAAELESTTPVAAKTNGEKWWNGNCERIDADIRKMEGEIDVAFVGDSITARWRGSENWEKHWGSYRAVNKRISKFAGGSVEYMDITSKYLESDDTISKEVMHDFLHLAPKGYDVWADAISGKVKENLGATPSGKK